MHSVEYSYHQSKTRAFDIGELHHNPIFTEISGIPSPRTNYPGNGSIRLKHAFINIGLGNPC